LKNYVWIVRYDDKNDDVITVYDNEKAARKSWAGYVIDSISTSMSIDESCIFDKMCKLHELGQYKKVYDLYEEHFKEDGDPYMHVWKEVLHSE
jgi:hypothetical protein